MDALLHEFERAQRGNGRLIVISAEAGVGKTTIVDAFIRALADRGDAVRVGRGRCSERLAGSEAYLPVLEALDSLQHNEQLGGLSRLMRAVAPSWYAQIMPASKDESSASRLAAETAGGSQERLKREIRVLLAEVARMQPVVLCFDDVHWADPSTTDLLAYLARRIDDMRLLIIVTARPSELAQAHHPFLSLKHDLVSHDLCREIVPGHLDVAAIGRYLALQFPGHAFPAGLAGMIHQRTEGHPLFVVDLLRDLRRRQVLRQEDGQWILAEELDLLARAMPESMRSLVQRKMDGLDEVDARLLGAASVQGIDFDSAVIAAATDTPQEEVEDRLQRLEREHALVRFVDEWEGPDRWVTLRYRFAHHIYHNAFYNALRATRRIVHAKAIAERLIARNGTQPCDCAADIALLFDTAREPVRAAEYFNLAAQAAARLYAHDETERLALRGLALLEGEPASPARAAAELGLQMTYGLSLKTSRGYAVAEVGAAYARARELCHQVDDPARVIPVLMGLSAHHIVSGEIETSRDVALEMLALFDRLGDPHLQMLGQWSLGAALFHLGELEVSHHHLARGLELYDPAFHKPRIWETGIEPGVFCRCEFSRTLALRGYPDQGLAGEPAGGRAGAGAAASADPRLLAAVPDVRPPGAARACRRARCLRRAVAPLPNPRHRAGTPVGHAAARPGARGAGRGRSRPQGARRRPRGPYDHALRPAAAVLLHAVRGSAHARQAVGCCPDGRWTRRVSWRTRRGNARTNRSTGASRRRSSPSATSARTRSSRTWRRWQSRASRGPAGSSCARRAATRRSCSNRPPRRSPRTARARRRLVYRGTPDAGLRVLGSAPAHAGLAPLLEAGSRGREAGSDRGSDLAQT